MPPLAERQHGFAAALLDPALAAPEGLVGPDGAPCPKRFAVYRNNVVVGLTDYLEESFPAVRRLVGEEFFRAMAAIHVPRDPPRSPILLEYGAGFPKFIAGFEPAAELPYLADVARLERAWLEAYHAAEATPLDRAAFSALPAERLGAMHIALHPSLRVVSSRYPVLTIWRMNVDDGAPGPVDLDGGGEDVLVIRPDAEVTVRAMPTGAADFLLGLRQGQAVAEAFAAALAVAPEFDLAQSLVELIGAGAFIGAGFSDVAPAGTAP